MGRFPWWHEVRDKGTVGDQQREKPVCATCGHKFRSGEERSVHDFTGEQTCDNCMYGGRGRSDADTSTLEQIKTRYGIETRRKFDEDGNIIEVLGSTGKFVPPQRMFHSANTPPAKWRLERDEKRAEQAKFASATDKERMRMARYKRTHGLLPRDDTRY